MGYSLKINYKKIESDPKKSTPESRKKRDRQFIYIDQMREVSREQNTPRISVDAKKRELVGNFKNQGATWSINSKEVSAYDFRSLASGVFIPLSLMAFTILIIITASLSEVFLIIQPNLP